MLVITGPCREISLGQNGTLRESKKFFLVDNNIGLARGSLYSLQQVVAHARMYGVKHQNCHLLFRKDLRPCFKKWGAGIEILRVSPTKY